MAVFLIRVSLNQIISYSIFFTNALLSDWGPETLKLWKCSLCSEMNSMFQIRLLIGQFHEWNCFWPIRCLLTQSLSKEYNLWGWSCFIEDVKIRWGMHKIVMYFVLYSPYVWGMHKTSDVFCVIKSLCYAQTLWLG